MKIIKSFLLIIATIILIAFAYTRFFASENINPGLIYAAGGIDVTFDEDGWPFLETNFLPGDEATKWITVINNSTRKKRIGLKIRNTALSDGWFLPTALLLRIKDDQGKIIYGGADGKALILSYLMPFPQKLFDLPKNSQKRLEVRVKFKEQANNLYQNRSTMFNFSLGFIGTNLPNLP
ncbi:hypothetical protein A2773_05675 [Candidatus Gottesmanbacteria bacterium RIFCSPHIGHO2_01_FULL_39_10]|uniref:Uncharacterized protein n=1 Tax=Candidatus Gottesmanbacteria bacterium RIFCSPHIGHO2_01_FULL_39_10 TaxID=1798375 RepID=A0A1F5ZN07_9BACT|nr:MAG: hypothetical protein A2773_05675 [Candidatus Gottesmanbacteria bacterium RIFCSPHIGHO2_01_FULL_39_10]